MMQKQDRQPDTNTVQFFVVTLPLLQFLKRKVTTPVSKEEVRFKIGKVAAVSRRQFPLNLSWASTIQQYKKFRVSLCQRL